MTHHECLWCIKRIRDVLSMSLHYASRLLVVEPRATTAAGAVGRILGDRKLLKDPHTNSKCPMTTDSKWMLKQSWALLIPQRGPIGSRVKIDHVEIRLKRIISLMSASFLKRVKVRWSPNWPECLRTVFWNLLALPKPSKNNYKRNKQQKQVAAFLNTIRQ